MSVVSFLLHSQLYMLNDPRSGKRPFKSGGNLSSDVVSSIVSSASVTPTINNCCTDPYDFSSKSTKRVRYPTPPLRMKNAVDYGFPFAGNNSSVNGKTHLLTNSRIKANADQALDPEFRSCQHNDNTDKNGKKIARKTDKLDKGDTSDNDDDYGNDTDIGTDSNKRDSPPDCVPDYVPGYVLGWREYFRLQWHSLIRGWYLPRKGSSDAYSHACSHSYSHSKFRGGGGGGSRCKSKAKRGSRRQRLQRRMLCLHQEE